MSNYDRDRAADDVAGDSVDEGLLRLEQAIFEARDFVTPSNDLRPRTLEQAKQVASTQGWANRLTLATLAGMLVWCISVPLLQIVSQHRERLSAPFADEILQAAQEYDEQHRYEPQWGMVEVFREARQLNTSSN